MADNLNKETRSFIMSRIRSKDTKPEIIVRKFIHSKGFRFRLHDRKLPGTPDIVLPKYKSVILVHGCFWHGHEGCENFKLPKTRREWWGNKIKRTKLRDLENEKALISNGWKVYTIYECRLKKKLIESTLEEVISKIKASE